MATGGLGWGGRPPLRPTQWSDLDGDGYGDNMEGLEPDSLAKGAHLPVDDRGCSDFQRDTDGDKIFDDSDPCVNSSLNLCFNAVTGSGGKEQITAAIALDNHVTAHCWNRDSNHPG